QELLEQLPFTGSRKIIGITGPPGAGKSTLTDQLIAQYTNAGKRVAVLCIDPSSPFHKGALLGDRIRMSRWHANEQVYIRSLASRGSLGGLHPSIIEITDLLSAAPFDKIIIETVGVGQSEVEIAGLADITVVVLVPESGDEIQSMKAGLMEVADIFVVNKSDRPDADLFLKNIENITHQSSEIKQIFKTISTSGEGIHELYQALEEWHEKPEHQSRTAWLLAEKAYQLIIEKRMRDISKKSVLEEIQMKLKEDRFNLYQFVKSFA
ncbi:MAG: methylmalonyl Co-A mutase-associated GTPase MeaB, partial [Chitinophagaceae bacterium]